MLCAALRGTLCCAGPCAVSPDRSAFYRPRLLGGGGGERGGRGGFALPLKPSLGLSASFCSSPAGAAALPPCRSLSAQFCLGKSTRSTQRAVRARLPPAYGAAGSEAPHPAPLRPGTRSPERWHGVNCQPKDWVVRPPPLPPFSPLFFQKEIHGESLR